MFRLRSSLFNLAAQFTGKWAPFQGVTLSPLAGGICVTASDRGAATFLGFDPNGHAAAAATFLPDKDLVSASKGIKSAQRELTIDGDTATVTTYYKEHSKSQDFPIAPCSEQPPLQEAIAEVLRLWGEEPELSTTAGRYDLGLLTKAVRTINEESDQLVISGYHGGPLRLQSDALGCLVLIMPQVAQPIPPVPPWLADYADSA